jgi:DNA polymerase-3 subunit gamma/tau
MYLALYRRYRPQRFDDVVGQRSAISVLKQAVASKSLGHAYLFSGPRGCGKTTVARLIAKAVNCTSPEADAEPCGKCENCLSISRGDNLDIVEIDGASNNGVDEVRELKSHVALSPFNSRYKVYIIDEVHMLSLAAFNALLKTLEEPPENVIFILATTDPYKVPVTIRSRCQHIPFHRISESDMLQRLIHVSRSEGLNAEEEALREIARQADGALRDALSLFEQTIGISDGSVTLENVTSLLGGASYSELEKIFTLFRADMAKAYRALSELFSRGASPIKVMEGFFIIAKNLWICRNWGADYLNALDLSSGEKDFLQKESEYWSAQGLATFMDFCVDILPRTRAGMRIEVLSGLVFRQFMSILSSANHSDRNVIAHSAPVVSEEEDHVDTELVSPLPVANETPADNDAGEEARGLPPEASSAKVPVHPLKEVEKEVNVPASVRGSSGSDQVNSEPVVKGWEKMLAILRDENIGIQASLLNSVVSFEDNTIFVRFPVQCVSSFRTLSLDRNLYVIQELLGRVVEDLVIERIILVWNEEEKIFSLDDEGSAEIYDTPESAKIEQPELFPVEKRTEVPEKVDDKQDPPCANDEESVGDFREVVQEILNCTNGELVILKSDRQSSYEEEVE